MLQDPKHILKDLWGYTDFRGSQKVVIDAVMAGKDVLALLPTGGGKSICYQVPTMAREGICIVVSPLVALIKDQTASLKKRGIKAIGLTGGISENNMIELLDNAVFGNYKFLYLSPERLLHPMVRNRIQEMPVSLIAIDEAHCISQWGHDFRPAYLQCSLLRELAPGVPILALTATATQRVAHDIVDSLQLKAPLLFKDSLERRNITFSVVHTNDKRFELARLCKRLTGSGIVYVRSRRSSVALAQYLTEKGLGALFFHGGLSQSEKSDRLNAWLHNEMPIMVATNAFGMGIDKSDVELVVHYQTPDCIENYYQEAGRAGRNQKLAKAVLLHAPVDAQRAQGQFLSALPTVQDIKKVYKKLNANFQIAYGEGQETSHGFNFNAFCDHYNLPRGKTYNALRILDQNSVIALSEEFSKKTTVRCLVDNTTLFSYLDKKPEMAKVFQTLLRTYGGIFDFDTTINTHLIAKKTQKGENYVVEVLQQMKNDHILEYGHSDYDISITFLVPREDEKTINPLSKKVQDLIHRKVDGLKQMLGYVNNDTLCRSKQLLTYFGEETSQDCGQCDVCTNPEGDMVAIGDSILELLRHQAMGGRELLHKLSVDKEQIIHVLKLLLEEGKIKVNPKNEYEFVPTNRRHV